MIKSFQKKRFFCKVFGVLFGVLLPGNEKFLLVVNIRLYIVIGDDIVLNAKHLCPVGLNFRKKMSVDNYIPSLCNFFLKMLFWEPLKLGICGKTTDSQL